MRIAYSPLPWEDFFRGLSFIFFHTDFLLPAVHIPIIWFLMLVLLLICLVPPTSFLNLHLLVFLLRPSSVLTSPQRNFLSHLSSSSSSTVLTYRIAPNYHFQNQVPCFRPCSTLNSSDLFTSILFLFPKYMHMVKERLFKIVTNKILFQSWWKEDPQTSRKADANQISQRNSKLKINFDKKTGTKKSKRRTKKAFFVSKF